MVNFRPPPPRQYIPQLLEAPPATPATPVAPAAPVAASPTTPAASAGGAAYVAAPRQTIKC